MLFTKGYIQFEEELWQRFEVLVRKGARFPELIHVQYPIGINPKGLMRTTEGRSSFLAKELVSNPNYKLKPDIGPKDLIVEFNHVEFIDTKDNKHKLEPDVIDLYWVCEILDSDNKDK